MLGGLGSDGGRGKVLGGKGVMEEGEGVGWARGCWVGAVGERGRRGAGWVRDCWVGRWAGGWARGGDTFAG